MERFALDDLQEVKTASQAAELHFVVEGLGGIVLMEVGVQQRAVTAVEGCQPGFEGAARRGFRNRWLRLRWSLGNRWGAHRAAKAKTKAKHDLENTGTSADSLGNLRPAQYSTSVASPGMV